MLLKYELKQNFRYRLRILILLLLLSVVTFFLIIQISIYYKSVSEIAKARNTYRTVVTIEHTELEEGEKDYISYDILNQIKKQPYVIKMDDRHLLAGINPELNPIMDYYNEVYIIGKVLDIKGNDPIYDIDLEINQLISGILQNNSKTIKVKYDTRGPDNQILEIGNSYYISLVAENPMHINDFYNINMNEKERNEFFVRAYLNAGRIISNSIIYTTDIESIPTFHEGATQVVQGEYFNDDDYAQGMVCIISEKYAAANDLSIGDKIGMYMFHGGHNFSGDYIFASVMHYTLLEQKAIPDISNAPYKEYEIVGIYENRIQGGKNSIAPNTIFLPSIELPRTLWDSLDEYFKDKNYTSLVSYVIETGKENEFMDALKKDNFPLNDYEIIINDGGYKKVAECLTSMKENALQFILLFLIAMLATLVLFVYLLIGRNWKNYITMRMLGIKQKHLTRTVLSSVFLIGLIGVTLGTVAGGYLSSRLIGQAYEQAKESVLGTDFRAINRMQVDVYQFSTSVPLPILIAISGGVILLLLIISVLGLKGLEGKKDVKIFLS